METEENTTVYCLLVGQLCAHKPLSGNVIESNRFKRRQGKTSLQQRLGYYKCHHVVMVVSNGDNGITDSNGDRRKHNCTISRPIMCTFQTFHTNHCQQYY